MSQHKIILEWLRRELKVQSLLKASNANTCWPLRMFSIAHWLWKLKGKSSLLVSKKLKKRYHRHVPHTWRNKSVKIGKKKSVLPLIWAKNILKQTKWKWQTWEFKVQSQLIVNNIDTFWLFRMFSIALFGLSTKGQI